MGQWSRGVAPSGNGAVERELAGLSAQRDLLTAMLAGTLDGFFRETLGLLDEGIEFEPYSRMDED